MYVEKRNYSFSSGTVILKPSKGTPRDIPGREKMKGVITMKNTKKLVAAMIALVLLIGIIPSSQAESTLSFANTHWYAKNILCDYVDTSLIDSDTQFLLDVLGVFVKFVPYEEWLYDYSAFAFYCGIDFGYDGCFYMNMAYAAFGEIDPDSYMCLEGTWEYSNNRLFLCANGERIPLQYNNGVLSLDIYGLGVEFAQA